MNMKGGLIGPVVKTLRKPVRRLRRRMRRAFESESLELPQRVWDREYQSGKWDYLGSLPQFARFAILAGYVKMLGGRDAEILEVGCGTGILHDYLSDIGFSRYQGIDLSAKAIEKVEDRNDEKSTFATADGGAYEDGHTYDLIIFNEVLHYFDDPVAVLDHYSRILNDGGTLLISMVEGLGSPSERHWEAILAHYTVMESVRVTNGQGTSWNCRAVRPSH